MKFIVEEEMSERSVVSASSVKNERENTCVQATRVKAFITVFF